MHRVAPDALLVAAAAGLHRRLALESPFQEGGRQSGARTKQSPGVGVRRQCLFAGGLPPKCPELNAQENAWQFMRDNWLSTRVFDTIDALLDHCCDAWNKLEAQPWTIMSLGLRDWIHRF
jgi:hypothetical protein